MINVKDNILKNEIAINDSETTTEKWFAIQDSYVDKIINDNISYTKWGDYMEKQTNQK